MGLFLFRDTVIRSPKYPIQSHLQTVLLNQITLERKGDVIDRGAVKSCTEMLLEMKENNGNDPIYIADFENLFIETSREFYRVESDDLVRRFDPPEYMRKVGSRPAIPCKMLMLKLSSKLTHPNTLSLIGRIQTG